MAISSGTMKSIKMKCLLFWFVNNGSYLSSVTMSLVVCHSAPLSPIINIKFCNTFALLFVLFGIFGGVMISKGSVTYYVVGL